MRDESKKEQIDAEEVTQKSVNPAKMIIPACPYCRTDLVVNASPFQLGNYTMLTVFCAGCRSVIACFPVGFNEPRVVTPESPIVRLD